MRTEREAERKRANHAADVAKDLTRKECEPLHMSRFARELAERLPEDVVVFDEALTNSPDLRRYLVQDTPGTYFQTRAGMLGTGLPGAIGLKLAHPDKVVFGFSGDGGSISTIQALATAARHNIGAKFVVCNNGSYRILKYNLRQYWGRLREPLEQSFPVEFDLRPPTLRFDQIAEAQGVHAVRVEHGAGIAPAIDRALATDGPFLIDLVLSSEL
jgi:benzoylformate decarboxylase